jgi:hypothetical protein
MAPAIDEVPDEEKLDFLANELREQADRMGGFYPHLRANLNKNIAALPDRYPDLAAQFPEQAVRLRRFASAKTEDIGTARATQGKR